MRLKDKILIATAALLIVTWLFPPMTESPRYHRSKYEEKPEKFDGFHFILSNDPYVSQRVLAVAWAKLVMLNLVIVGIGGVCCFVVSKKD